MKQLVIVTPSSPSILNARDVVIPIMIPDAGERAARRFLEFFAATIRNKNTRTAYLHAVGRFFAWCEPSRRGQRA
jgi:hypothetical protein